MAQIHKECVNNFIKTDRLNYNKPVNVLPNHLLKIDFPLVTQEFQENKKHLISTFSEKALDPNGCVIMKTKVDHYLYTSNTSNEIGKPFLSDIIRFPQEILTTYKKPIVVDDKNKCDGESSPNNNNFKKVQVKSNYKLVRSKTKKESKKNRKKSINDSCETDEDFDFICQCPRHTQDADSYSCSCSDSDE